MPNNKNEEQSGKPGGFGLPDSWIIQYNNNVFFDFFGKRLQDNHPAPNLRIYFDYTPFENPSVSLVQSLIDGCISPVFPELAAEQSVQTQRILGAFALGPSTPCLLPVFDGAQVGQLIMNSMLLALGDSIRCVYASALYPLFQPNSFVRSNNDNTTALLINASAPISATAMSELAAFACSAYLPDSLNQAHRRTVRKIRPMLFMALDFLNLQLQPGRLETICPIQFGEEPFNLAAQQYQLQQVAERHEVERFLAYLLKGALDAHEFGIDLSPFSASIEAWKNHQDPVALFLKKCCRLDTGDSTKAEELWKWFLAFCDCYNIIYNGADQSFFKRLTALHGNSLAKQGGRIYRRLVLKDDALRILKRFRQARDRNEIADFEAQVD